MYLFVAGIIFGIAITVLVLHIRIYRMVRLFTPKKLIWAAGISVVLLVIGTTTLQWTNPGIMKGAVVTSGSGGTSITFTCTGHLRRVQDFFLNSKLQPVAVETETVFGSDWPSRVCNDG